MVIKPPARGAITGATRPGQTSSDITLSSSALAVSASTTSRPTGTIIAPPAPWTTRNATSSARLELSAQASDERVKMTIAAMNTRRAPHRAANQPLSGISTARVIR